MAQISVPSSLIYVTDSLGSVTSAFNAADLVDAVNDPAQTKYMQVLGPGGAVFGTANIEWGMQALVDPLVDVDHKIHVFVRCSANDLAQTPSAQFLLVVETTTPPDMGATFFGVLFSQLQLSTSFTELTYTLSALEVQTFRAAGAYPDFRVKLIIEPYTQIDVAYIYFEAPNAGPPGTWWYDPVTDSFKFQAADPGGTFVASAGPGFDFNARNNPEQGEDAGGTAVIISGEGFADNATVTFNGVLGTGTTIPNQHTMFVNTPAFGGVHTETRVIRIGEDFKSANVTPVDVVLTNPDGGTATMTNGFLYYTVAPMWWDLGVVGGFQFSEDQPEPVSYDFGFFIDGVFYPPGYLFTWNIAAVTPTDTGWWESNIQFAGQSTLINNSRPKDPRSYTEIAAFATGTAGPLGGFPGPSCVFNNRLVYAAGLYSPTIDPPSIRIFDGTFDREVIRLPDAGGVIPPVAIFTMLTANGTIYFSTYDSGSTSADWLGTVYSLDLETATVSAIGTVFPTGEIPYALAWHMGRLWCGTNRQNPAFPGKVYYFRPGVDTAWVLDHSLATEGLGGVSSLLSFKGLLYIGTTAPAGTTAKILVRSALGVYTVSNTGSGTAANNAYLAMVEYQDNLYASYWDSTPISEIRKFDNTTWSTVYTGAGTTEVPYVGLPMDDNILLAIGGSPPHVAALITTPDGTTWADKSVFLVQGTPQSTGVNVFGVVVH